MDSQGVKKCDDGLAQLFEFRGMIRCGGSCRYQNPVSVWQKREIEPERLIDLSSQAIPNYRPFIYPLTDIHSKLAGGFACLRVTEEKEIALENVSRLG